MTRTVNALTWSDAAQPGNALANYTVDFTQDPVWQFVLPGSYLAQPVQPRGVSVNNTNGNININVTIGNLAVSVDPFTRENIDFPANSQICTISLASGTATQVPISFYLNQPAPGAVGQNTGLASKQFSLAVSNVAFNFNTLPAAPVQLIPAGVNWSITSLQIALLNFFSFVTTLDGSSIQVLIYENGTVPLNELCNFYIHSWDSQRMRKRSEVILALAGIQQQSVQKGALMLQVAVSGSVFVGKYKGTMQVNLTYIIPL